MGAALSRSRRVSATASLTCQRLTHLYPSISALIRLPFLVGNITLGVRRPSSQNAIILIVDGHRSTLSSRLWESMGHLKMIDDRNAET